jgi:4-hydroxybenzoate polyprenyltransferase
VQRTIDRINARNAGGPLPNRGYTGANVVGIIIGSGVVMLVLAGAMLGG